MLHAANRDERTHGPAATEPVGQVLPPTAGGAELNRRCLFPGVTGGDGVRKRFMTNCGAKLIGDFHVDLYAANLSWQAADDTGHILCFAIDKNGNVGAAVVV